MVFSKSTFVKLHLYKKINGVSAFLRTFKLGGLVLIPKPFSVPNNVQIEKGYESTDEENKQAEFSDLEIKKPLAPLILQL